MPVQTREQKNQFQSKRALQIIKQAGEINRMKLCFMLGMTPKLYKDYFHGYLEELYDEKIEYDSELKLWRSLDKEKK